MPQSRTKGRPRRDKAKLGSETPQRHSSSAQDETGTDAGMWVNPALDGKSATSQVNEAASAPMGQRDHRPHFGHRPGARVSAAVPARTSLTKSLCIRERGRRKAPRALQRKAQMHKKTADMEELPAGDAATEGEGELRAERGWPGSAEGTPDSDHSS